MGSWIRQWRNRRKHEQRVEIEVVEGEVRFLLPDLYTRADGTGGRGGQTGRGGGTLIAIQNLSQANSQDEVDHQVEEVVVDQDAVRPEEVEGVGVDSRRYKAKAKPRQDDRQVCLSEFDIIAVNIMQTATRVWTEKRGD